MKPKLTRVQRDALKYFGLMLAKSDEDGCWFAYTNRPVQEPLHNYPGSSCENIETVEEYYRLALDNDKKRIKEAKFNPAPER